MATAVIIDNYSNRKAIPESVNYPLSSIKDIHQNSQIVDTYKNKTTTIKNSNYPVTSIKSPKKTTNVKYVLPYRVRFTTVGIPGAYNVPGIGLQVIGVSNWIL